MKRIGIKTHDIFCGNIFPWRSPEISYRKKHKNNANSLFWEACNFAGSDYSTPHMGVGWNRMGQKNNFHIDYEALRRHKIFGLIASAISVSKGGGLGLRNFVMSP